MPLRHAEVLCACRKIVNRETTSLVVRWKAAVDLSSSRVAVSHGLDCSHLIALIYSGFWVLLVSFSPSHLAYCTLQEQNTVSVVPSSVYGLQTEPGDFHVPNTKISHQQDICIRSLSILMAPIHLTWICWTFESLDKRNLMRHCSWKATSTAV